MSTCCICGAPTDLALSDMLTVRELHVNRKREVPLVGICAEEACKERAMTRHELKRA